MEYVLFDPTAQLWNWFHDMPLIGCHIFYNAGDNRLFIGHLTCDPRRTIWPSLYTVQLGICQDRHPQFSYNHRISPFIGQIGLWSWADTTGHLVLLRLGGWQANCLIAIPSQTVSSIIRLVFFMLYDISNTFPKFFLNYPAGFLHFMWRQSRGLMHWRTDLSPNHLCFQFFPHLLHCGSHSCIRLVWYLCWYLGVLRVHSSPV